jgi:hypothetical protein
MQKHSALMSKFGQSTNLFWLVNRPHLGRLRNRDNLRLHMMLIADAVIRMPHCIERDFPVLMRQRNQLATQMLLGRGAFVGIYVRIVAAQHRLIGPRQRLQAQHIRPGAVESKKNFNPRPEMFFKLCHGRARVPVVAISNHVAFIDPCKGLQNFRMNSRVVIAGKAACDFHDRLWHKQTM